eukprot:12755351-Ditylum_brightwellii.AAC.1
MVPPAFLSAKTTPGVFLNQINKYKNFFGMVPILVGGSIDLNKRCLQENHARGTVSFEEIGNEYNTTNLCKCLIYNSSQQELDLELSQYLLEKCVGFDNFLGAVDDERKQTLSALKMEQKAIEVLDHNVSIFVHTLLSIMNVIMTNDSGNDALGVLGSKTVTQEVSMTALEEEEEFASNYYNSNCRYELYDHHAG